MTKFRYFLLVLGLIILSQLNLKAQTNNIPVSVEDIYKGDSYYEIVKRAESYFSLNPDTSEDGPQIEFNRWAWYWRTRVQMTGDATGSFVYARRAGYDLMQNPSQVICSPSNSSDPSNWQCLGPNTLPSQNMGKIVSLYIDSTNHNYLLAGSVTGGAFKSTDGGTNWACITDATRFPTLSAVSIAVAPNTNNQTIYISGGEYRNHNSNNKQYGLGVLKSTDGGGTWNNTGLTFPPEKEMVVQDFKMDPKNSAVLYALVKDNANSSGGTDVYYLYKTVNAGLSFFYPDLYSKDTPQDNGLEPNVFAGPYYVSTDLWIRQQNDGFTNQTTQKAIYRDPSLNQPNYVYVKVRNRGCQYSSGNDSLKTYWAKSMTSLTWPYPWGGSNPSGLPVPWGGALKGQRIAALAPGDSAIYQFEWYPPNPINYSQYIRNTKNPDIHHFCILSRIENSPVSPFGMTYPEQIGIGYNIEFNNNIVMCNFTVMEAGGGITINKDAVGIRNANPHQSTSTILSFTVPPAEKPNSILDHAIISVDLGTALMQKWVAGGMVGSNIQVLNSTSIRVLKPDAWIGNITLSANETEVVTLSVIPMATTLPKVATNFSIDIVQTDNNKVMGGERFLITLNPPLVGGGLRKANTPTKSPMASSDDLDYIVVYPNPAHEELVVSYPAGAESILELVDMVGKVVFKGKFANEIKINIAGLSKGVLLCESY